MFFDPPEVHVSTLFFNATNTVALIAWCALVLFPSRRLLTILCGCVVPTLLASCYFLIIVWKFAENGPPPEDVMTINGLRSVFSDDWVFVAAWTHYLCFDLFVGAWIARDAVRIRMPAFIRTASLILTFLSGPIGFLLYMTARTLLQRSVCIDDTPLKDQSVTFDTGNTS